MDQQDEQILNCIYLPYLQDSFAVIPLHNQHHKTWEQNDCTGVSFLIILQAGVQGQDHPNWHQTVWFTFVYNIIKIE